MKEDIQKELDKTEKQIVNNIHSLVQATDGKLHEKLTASPDSLAAGFGEGDQPVVLDGVEIHPPNSNSLAKLEIQAAEEKQRRQQEQYAKDKAFFAEKVLKPARGTSEIQEDFIKVLHPHFREKFIDGIRRYGTVASAMKWMKDNHGLKLRGDVLRRISQVIPSFKQEIDDALDEYQASIHMEMHRRAIEGVDKGIYHQGERIDTEKVYSDSLLVKMADTHNPEYREAKKKQGNQGNVVNVQIIKDFHNYKE